MNGLPTKNDTVSTVLGYLPAILDALRLAFQIHSEVGHADAAKIITDSLNAAGTVGLEIPEAHAQLVGAIATTVAPQVQQMVQAAKPVSPASPAPAAPSGGSNGAD